MYRHGDYTSALETISRAIQVAKVASPAQLDLLVACKEKTSDFDGALESAKTLIRQHTSDPVGYFRAAHVLLQVKRPEAAVKIYERGLKVVPKEHASYRKLLQKHQQLLTSLAPPKSSDPFTAFPLEVVELILTLLNFRERL